MKFSKKITMMLASLILAPAVANASVTINLSGGYLYSSGSTPLANGRTVVLLADANNNSSFGNLTQATGSFLADPGDLVVARFAMNNNLDDGAFQTAISNILLSGTPDGLQAGEKLMLVWYDIPFDPSASAAPGFGAKFGTFRSDSVVNGSSTAWVVPSDGALINLNFLTENLGGTSLESAGVASQTTVAAVPEPTSLAILFAGASLLFAHRRRARA